MHVDARVLDARGREKKFHDALSRVMSALYSTTHGDDVR
jgi:hypothetical protein